MNTMKKTALLCLLLCISYATQAQHKWMLLGEIYHQDFGTSFSVGQLEVLDATPIHPGLRLGIERSWVETNRFRLFQGLSAGYFHHTYVEKVLTLGTDIGFEYRIVGQLRSAFKLGAHYNSVQPNDPRYTYNGERWVRSENTDPRVNRLNVPASLNIGWRFGAESKHPIDVCMVLRNGQSALLSYPKQILT
jgi:hypothetical protein